MPIRITFARTYDSRRDMSFSYYVYPKINRKSKGSFALTFDSIEDLARFLVYKYPRCGFIPIHIVSSNLNREQRIALNKKLLSLERQNYRRLKSEGRI